MQPLPEPQPQPFNLNKFIRTLNINSDNPAYQTEDNKNKVLHISQETPTCRVCSATFNSKNQLHRHIHSSCLPLAVKTTQPDGVTIQEDIPQPTTHENKTPAKTTQPTRVSSNKDIPQPTLAIPLRIDSGKPHSGSLTPSDVNGLNLIQVINKAL